MKKIPAPPRLQSNLRKDQLTRNSHNCVSFIYNQTCLCLRNIIQTNAADDGRVVSAKHVCDQVLWQPDKRFDGLCATASTHGSVKSSSVSLERFVPEIPKRALVARYYEAVQDYTKTNAATFLSGCMDKSTVFSKSVQLLSNHDQHKGWYVASSTSDPLSFQIDTISGLSSGARYKRH